MTAAGGYPITAKLSLPSNENYLSPQLARLLDRYRGRSVADAVGGELRDVGCGRCCTIERCAPAGMAPPSRERATASFLSELRLLFGIGTAHDRRLREQGYESIPSLLSHPRFAGLATALLEDWGEPLDPARVNATLSTWLPASHPLFLQLPALVPYDRILFFDLETLGLFGVPIILAALGRPGAAEIRITQYLACSIDEEVALLEGVGEALSHASLILSYNGKSFDWTYLRERFAYYGLRFDYAPIHIDLLHHARRAYRDLLPDVRLGTIEERVLGVSRTEDLPGEAVPEYYEAYLQSGNPGPLVPIVNHNQQDVATLALLFTRLLQAHQ